MLDSRLAEVVAAERLPALLAFSSRAEALAAFSGRAARIRHLPPSFDQPRCLRPPNASCWWSKAARFRYRSSQGPFSSRRVHEARPGSLLPGGSGRRARPGRKALPPPSLSPPYHREFFFLNRAPGAALFFWFFRGSRSSRCAFLQAARRKRWCRAMRRLWSGWLTSRASSCIRIRCARMISIIPTSCAWISIRFRASVAASARRGARRAGDAGRLRPRRLAQDFGLARHARSRAHPSAMDVRRSAPRGAGARARSRAARSHACHEQVVEGGAPWGVSRLQPERQGPTTSRPRTRCVRCRCSRVRAADLGRGPDACEPADFTLATMPSRFARR